MMDINDFKEGEEFLLVTRMPYGSEILSITEFKCKKVLKTCIKTTNNRQFGKNMFKDCYPLGEYQALNKQRKEYCIKKYKEQFQKKNKTRFELICIVKAAAELLGGNNENNTEIEMVERYYFNCMGQVVIREEPLIVGPFINRNEEGEYE